MRAVARAIPTSNSYRLTVVAADRPGLLADTAATLASEGVSIIAASVMTWPSEGLALHAVTVQSTREFDHLRWATIGQRLREMAGGSRPTFDFVPGGRARVTHTGEGDGKSIVRVTAPDQLGLLAAVCRWLADHGGSIEAADITTVDGEAKDVFLVEGDVDTVSLARHLSARPGPTPCAMVRSLWRTVRG